jgi:hypothetical protein
VIKLKKLECENSGFFVLNDLKFGAILDFKSEDLDFVL